MGKKRKKVVQRHSPAAVNPLLSPLTSANNTAGHIALLAVLVILIYSNTLNVPFQWDEGMFIVGNPIIKDLHYFINPWEAKGFEHYDAFLGRYIGYLTFALNYKLHGFSVAGYHIVNIALHFANSVLVYFLVVYTFRTPFIHRALIPRREFSTFRGPAFFSAAIFAGHPLQTEAINYIFQRFVPLAAFFYLASLIMYIKFRLAKDSSQSAEGPHRGRGQWQAWLYYGISIFSAVLAMKTKENAFTLPFVIAIYEFYFFEDVKVTAKAKDQRTIRFFYLFPLLLTLLIIPLTRMILSDMAHKLNLHSYNIGFTQEEYLFTQFRVIITYLRLLFFPVNQTIDYDYPLYHSFFKMPVLLSFVFLLITLGTGIFLLWRSRRNTALYAKHSLLSGLIGFGILWFFIALSIESSIIPIPMLICEYRVYLPSVGAIICIVTAFFLLKERFLTPEYGKFSFVLLSLVVVVLSVTSHLRNETWRDRISLWRDAVMKSPANARAHNNLGLEYMEKGLLDEAMKEFSFAVMRKPDYADAHYNLGNIYQNLNFTDKAVEQYLITIKLNPDYAKAHNNLGNIYQARNLLEKAMYHYLITVKLKPDDAESHNNLGTIYHAKNLVDKAVEQYLIAVKLDPGLAQGYYNLGVVYQTHKMPEKAIGYYLNAIKLNPDYADARFNLGLVYYNLGQIKKARTELIEVLRISPTASKARQLLKETS